MMTEENWKKLRETFDDESKFEKFTEEDGDETWTEEWYTTGIPGDLGIAADLYDWLECSSVKACIRAKHDVPERRPCL